MGERREMARALRIQNDMGSASYVSNLLNSVDSKLWGCPELTDSVGRVKDLRNPHEDTVK
jgi:hypothetical protein